MPIPGVVASSYTQPVTVLVYPTNTAFHFDAAEAVRNGSNQITSWPDKKAGLFNLTPYLGAGEAVKTMMASQNGLWAVSFSGAANAVMINTTGGIFDASNMAVFGVAKTRAGVQRVWMEVGKTAGMTHGGDSTYIIGWGELQEGVNWWLPRSQLLDTYHLQTFIIAGNSALLRLNGSTVATTTLGPRAAVNEVTLGGDMVGTVICDICEVIGIKGTITVAERDHVEAFLRTKWAV